MTIPRVRARARQRGQRHPHAQKLAPAFHSDLPLQPATNRTTQRLIIQPELGWRAAARSRECSQSTISRFDLGRAGILLRTAVGQLVGTRTDRGFGMASRLLNSRKRGIAQPPHPSFVFSSLVKCKVASLACLRAINRICPSPEPGTSLHPVPSARVHHHRGLVSLAPAVACCIATLWLTLLQSISPLFSCQCSEQVGSRQCVSPNPFSGRPRLCLAWLVVTLSRQLKIVQRSDR